MGDLNRTLKPSSDEIYIAVMGVTGAGKSRFIRECSGLDVPVGHTLESCKKMCIELHRCHASDIP
jgi:ABC-type lipoprotein export system ATPase subunit